MKIKSKEMPGPGIKEMESEEGGEVRKQESFRGRRGWSVRSLGVVFQLLALLLAISAVLRRWPAAPALTPS